MRITPRQLDVICCIRNNRHVKGYSPTIREIASQLGISRVTVVQHVKALIRKKYIRHTPRTARTLEVIADVREPLPLAS